MRYRKWLSVSLVGWVFAAAAAPTSSPKSVVRCPTARFTVLTDRLIRMESAADGEFEDRPSFVFINRELPTPEFTATPVGDGVVIETRYVRLTYRGGCFSPENLSAEIFAAPSEPEPAYRWRFGEMPRGNLGGTARTLDSCDGFESLRHRLERGLVSRDGWVALDDSATPLLECSPGPWRAWHSERRAGAREDWYLFAHGHDYRAALRDYVRVAGAVAMPPRWLFGYWWCRYWPYSDRELTALADGIVGRGLPLDVVIADMDWHETWGIGKGGGTDEWGQLVGWTGYTWQRQMFPEPGRFLADMHARSLKVALNLHPASGITSREDGYRDFCRRLGIEADGATSAYAAEDPAWAAAWFGAFIEPLERQGVDFWWIDWQQWFEAKTRPGLSNAWWLGYLFGQRARPPCERPVLYSRWGGLGSHRNQVGFSGDAFSSWEVLRMLPYFTATAANQACGYWGHDLGGMSGASAFDEELFVRWFQSAVTQPILKTHAGRNAKAERRVWMLPDSEAILREALDFRYRLAPYLYTAARSTVETGLAIARPLYYDESECEAAYDEHALAYRLGEDVVAVTVGEKADPTTGVATVAFHLPPGAWYDLAVGEVVKGGDVLRGYTLAENPVFLRVGAILPLYPASVRNLSCASDRELELLVAPGATAGAAELYEDDGESAIGAGNGAFTAFGWRSEGRSLKLTLSPRRGTYPGAGADRRYTLKFPNRLSPLKVAVDGREYAYAPRPQELAWSYDGGLPGVVVRTPPLTVGEEHRVELEFAAEGAAAGDARLNGLGGLQRRLSALGEELKDQYVRFICWSAMVDDAYLSLCALPSKLEREPGRTGDLLDDFAVALKEFWPRFQPVADRLDPAFVKRLRAQLHIGAAVDPAALPPPATLAALRSDWGFDATHPAFSWQTLADGDRRQEAWRIEVTDADGREVWDSGVRWSDLAVSRAYEGPALASGVGYRWRVMTLDQYRRWSESEWTELAVPASPVRVAGFAADAAAHPLGGYLRREGGGFEFSCADAEIEAAVRTNIAKLVGGDTAQGENSFAAVMAEYRMYGDERPLRAAYQAAKARVRAVAAKVETASQEELLSALAECDSLFPAANILGELLDEDRLYFETRFALARRLREGGGVKPVEAMSPSSALAPDASAAAVVEYAVATLAGIQEGAVTSAPAYKGVRLQLPEAATMRHLKSVAATLKTPYGEVRSRWTMTADGSWDWCVALPVNVKAEIVLPDDRYLNLYGGEHRFHGRF